MDVKIFGVFLLLCGLTNGYYHDCWYDDNFYCGYGDCVPWYWVCDGISDCLFEEDEMECDCDQDEFECSPDQCILSYQKCDSNVDCDNGLDEHNCENHTCAKYQFQCTSGHCIWYGRCDGHTDCPDRSDEDSCGEYDCPSFEFKCVESGHCVDKWNLCDLKEDCADGSDELGCENNTCSHNHFRCETGHCVPSYDLCNGVLECPDGSDENGCEITCLLNYVKCDEVNECVWDGWICDDNPDCTDGSDEKECNETRCREDQYKCSTGECIGDWQRCDLIHHCLNNVTGESEETGCDDFKCSEEEFLCSSSHCVDYEKRCDFVEHCTDGSDEHNCLCPEIPDDSNIKVTHKGGPTDRCAMDNYNTLGCVVEFSCQLGYSGKAVLSECGRNIDGKWDKSFPVCSKDCPKFGPWLKVTPSSGCFMESYNKASCVVTFHCSSEFVPNNGSVTCGKNTPGIWSEMPVCVRKTCDKFGKGVVVTSSIGPRCNNTAYNMPSCKTNFKCDNGYSGMRGMAVCGLLGPGKWNYIPRCTASTAGKSLYNISKTTICLWTFLGLVVVGVLRY